MVKITSSAISIPSISIQGAKGPPPADSIPVNTTAPTVAGSTPVGSVLTCDVGSWGGYPPPSFSYQWQADNVDIPGANQATYTSLIGQVGQALRCGVIGTNSSGSSARVYSSNSITVTNALTAPVNTVAPVASGSPTVGSTLSCTPGTWTGNPTPSISHRWQADGVDIPGAVTNSYTLTSNELGKIVRSVVNGANSQGSTDANSNNIGPITNALSAPVNTVAPAVTGNTAVGSVLTTTNGTWTGNPTPTHTYQWQRNGTNIAGATAQIYTSQAGDVGLPVRCVVTATNSQGAVPANSNAITVTAALAAPVNTVAPVVTGTPSVGSVLTSTTGTWTGNPTPTYAYQWKSDADNVGTNQSTYTSVAGDVGKTVTCVVTATNSQGNANATSNGILIEASSGQSEAEIWAGAETNAVAICFDDDAYPYGSMVIRDTVTPANNYSNDPFGKLSWAMTSPTMVTDSDGLVKYAQNNLFLNSGAPVTQGVAVAVGASYKILITGTGSIVLTGANTGTVTAGTPATITATTTTLTCTVAGGPTTAQVILQPCVDDSYVATTAAAVYKPPMQHNAAGARLGLLVEEQRTNLLLNNYTSLVTQNVTVTAVAHALSFYGTGTITLSGASTGNLVGTGANNRVSLIFTPTAGTLTLTVTGTVTLGQLEAGAFPTSPIVTAAASATRAKPTTPILPSTSFNMGSALTQVGWITAFYVASPAEHNFYGVSKADYLDSFFATINGSFLNVVGWSAGTKTVDGYMPGFIDNVQAKTAIASATNNVQAAANAVLGTVGLPDTSHVMPAMTNLCIGRGYPTQTGVCNGILSRIKHVPRRMSDAELQTETT